MENWTKTEIGNIAGINKTTLTQKTSPDYEFFYVDIASVNEGKISFPKEKIKFAHAPSRARRIVQKGDVLMSTVRPNLQSFAHFPFDRKDVIASTGFAVLRPTARIDSKFLFHSIFSDYISKQISLLLAGSNYPALNSSEVENLILYLPPLGEQKKIAEILSTWDKSIETTEKLIAAKQKLKKSLMQRLLTGSQRFPEFHGQEWKTLKISDFTKQAIRIKNKPDKPFLAMGIRSHGKGTFLKPDFEPSKIDMTELYEVKENDLIVNITFAWEGAIAIVGRNDEGALVSHRFPTYEFQTERMIPEFFRYVIRQKEFVERLGIISPGGAGRNRVLSKKDFVKLEIKIPKVEEQKKIAAVLNSCDAEINVLQNKLAALQKQKRGLMQKLLTGKVRVKTEAS